MSSKLKIEELRAELSCHGLDTNGTKPTLVRRLDAALRKEEKEAAAASKDASASDASNGGKKRPRDSGNEDADQEGNAVKKLQEMSVRDLRERATSRGLSTSGSKKELLARLSVDAVKDPEESAEATAEEEGSNKNGSRVSPKKAEEIKENQKEKLVTATKKGAAVLDQYLPDDVKSCYHVLQLEDEIYDAVLNQTNVGDNNNKFYVIQVLEADHGGSFMVYNRWGRVGVRGQEKLSGPYTSQEKAINEFEKKFHDKTNNNWWNREHFKCYPKCYTWLEMDYSEDKKETDRSKTEDSTITQIQETKLEPRIAKFVSLICNVSMMKQQMLEIGYNAEKLPLGKLSKSTILKGYDVLRRISEVIGKSDRKTLEQLSGEFYTVVPHDFGFKKMREFVIDTPQKLKSKLEMVEALGEIEIASKLLEDNSDIQDDPVYFRYRQLHCELTAVEVDSEEYSLVKKYMLNTHAKTHSNYTVEIEHIFKVSREGESERFSKFSNTKNRMLLWHGSRLTNWTGILSQGLRIAPPEAPVQGYMFGKGVYFADMFSKSANYCFARPDSRAGVLLLCEVALGNMAELLQADYFADRLPEGKLSTKGIGGTAPDMSYAEVLEDGLVIPLGKPIQPPGPRGNLLYNEYIVYNVEQIRMRYVIQVNFNFRR